MFSRALWQFQTMLLVPHVNMAFCYRWCTIQYKMSWLLKPVHCAFCIGSCLAQDSRGHSRRTIAEVNESNVTFLYYICCTLGRDFDLVLCCLSHTQYCTHTKKTSMHTQCHIPPYTHIHSYTCMYTTVHTHAHTHTHTHAHMHTHTHTCTDPVSVV